VRKPLDDAKNTYLKNVVSPMWGLTMQQVSMIGKDKAPSPPKAPGLPGQDKVTEIPATKAAPPNITLPDHHGDGSHSAFVKTDDCNDEQYSGLSQLKCMMTQTKRLFEATGGKPDFSQLLMSKEQAEAMRGQLHRLDSGLGLLEINAQEKMVALEQGPGTLEGLQFGPEDDEPIPGPLETSLINPPSVSRYSHASPGLYMPGHLLTDIDPDAKCNDGSPGIYYLAEGDKTKFHLHLGGGYFCYNPRNCRKRVRTSPMLASSMGYEMYFTGGGIFDPVNGGLPGWTHATMSYCSSDAYFGQMDTSEFQVVNNTFIKNNVTGTHFRGYTMTQAMLRHYVRMGLGSAEGHQLVVSGCSAGSIAVNAQADSFISRVEKIFWQESGRKATFYPPSLTTVADNMPMLSPEPVTINFNGELQLFDQAMELVNHLYVKPGILDKAGEFLNADCTAHYKDNPAACVFPDRVMPFVKTNNLILSNLWDTFTLFNPATFFAPENSEQEAFAIKIDGLTREVVNRVAKTQNQWSIGCNDHCFTLNPWWWRLTPATAPNGMHLVSPRDMFHMTMKGDTGKIAMDECKTYNCGCIGHAQFYQLAGYGQFKVQQKYVTGFTTPDYGIGKNTPKVKPSFMELLETGLGIGDLI